MGEAGGNLPRGFRSTARDPLPPGFNDEVIPDFGEAIGSLEREESFCMISYDLAEVHPIWLPVWETGACDSALLKAIADGWLPDERTRALELGCGYGYTSLHLGELGFERVVGVDLALPAINRARRMARARGVADRVRFACYDVYDLPTPSRAFQFVYDNTLFNNTEVHTKRTVQEYMAGLRRVLSPGGLFILVFARNESGQGAFSSRVSGLPTPSLDHIRASFAGHMNIRSVRLDSVEYDIVDPRSRNRIEHPGGYAVMTPAW